MCAKHALIARREAHADALLSLKNAKDRKKLHGQRRDNRKYRYKLLNILSKNTHYIE
jgi:hypothetical protein